MAVLGAMALASVSSLTPASAALDKAKSAKLTPSGINQLEKEINKGKHLTYEATYEAVENGQTTTVTIAQSPPKSLFSAASGEIVDTGSTTYYCSTSGSTTCVSAGTGSSNPFVGLEDLFSPAAAVSALSAARQGLVARALGDHVSSSTVRIGGQTSVCVTVTASGQSGKYCVTKQGLLSYSGNLKTSYFELTKFTTSPPASLFQTPAGATVETLPGGVTIP